MAKQPIDMSKVSAQDLFPEGRFRARIVSADILPKDKEIGENAEVVGEKTKQGKQAYSYLRAGFRFVEHPANYAPDPNTGEVRPLAGRQIFANFSYHPEFRHNVRALFDNAGVDPNADSNELKDHEVDIIIKNKPSYNDEKVMESQVSGTRPALDR